MTAYEIITIFIGILALLMSFGSLIIASEASSLRCLPFSIREIIRRNKNALPVGKQVRLCS